MSSGLWPRFNNVIAGGSAPAPWVTFLSRAKKGNRKKARPGRSPRILRAVPCAPRVIRRSPNSPGAKYAPRARSGVTRKPLIALRCSARDTGLKQNTSCLMLRCVQTPVAADEHRSRPSGVSRASCLSPSRVVDGRRVEARADGLREAQGVFGGSGRAFSW
jgi:hypothetical protein